MGAFYPENLRVNVIFSSTYSSSIILVFPVLTPSQNFDGITPTGVLNTDRVGLYNFQIFDQYLAIMWDTIQDRAMVTMER